MTRTKCQGEYNGEAIQLFNRSGREKCWNLIKAMPTQFRAGATSAVKTTIKSSKRGKGKWNKQGAK